MTSQPGRYDTHFGDFGGRVWLNTAHQGPLPSAAADAAREAIAWKLAPFELTAARFSGVPRRLREALSGIIGCPADDIILANSASYGLHLLANGLPLADGDEVVVMRSDFPSDILPWLGLAPRGISTRQVVPRSQVLEPDEVAASLTPRTRVVCLTWVHSFSGHAIDLEAIGALCRDRDVWFVVNGSQAVGVRPIDVTRAPIDALIGVGFKWLCGPYGTGFCWIRPDLRERLIYNQAYWLSMQTADDLAGDDADVAVREGLGARTYDIFGTANFFNYTAWTTSVELVGSIGVEVASRHARGLVGRFLDGLDPKRYRVISPIDGPSRSTLVVVSDRDPSRNAAMFQALRDSGIDVARRRGRLRIAPHLHNTEAQIDRALEVLDAGRGVGSRQQAP